MEELASCISRTVGEEIIKYTFMLPIIDPAHWDIIRQPGPFSESFLERYKVLGHVGLQHSLANLLLPAIGQRHVGFYAVCLLSFFLLCSVTIGLILRHATVDFQRYSFIRNVREIASDKLTVSRCSPVEAFLVVVGAAVLDYGMPGLIRWFNKYLAPIVVKAVATYDYL
jgi:hypothetical protein